MEERSSDRDLFTGQGLQPQRVQRANEHRRAGGREEQIVEDERAFARDRREQSALLEQRRAPGEQCKAAADERRQNRKDEHAPLRIVGKGVNRGEHARAHQEGADQGQ